jgi:chromosome segregation ATPase
MASTVFPPVGTASIGTSESHPDLGTTKRTRGDDVSFMRYDMSEANERAARATIQAKQESHRARAANKARHQMANRMVSANKQLAAETQEVAKLRAAVDWTSGAQRTAAENSLQQKIELLDTAERERDTAQIKMRAAESRASLAMQTAKKEERDKLEWQRKFFELNSTKGGAIDDVARLETQVKRDAEKFERLDREYKALMEGQGALQEQIAAERASMSAQFDELNAERDKMMEARKLDASDTKEKERLALVVEDLQSQLADTSASFSKLQFVEQQLAGFQTQRDAAIAERDECVLCVASVAPLFP